MRTRNFLPLNLQLFAESEQDDPLLVGDEDEDITIDLEPEPEPEPDDELEVDPEPAPVDKPELDDSTEWVKKRLARAERAYERKFLEEVASQSDGVQLERNELPKAAKLWNLLKHNPDVSRAVDEVLRRSGEEGKLKALTEIRPDAKMSKMESAFDLREAEMELKYSDPVFKKYQEQIKDWAEDEGLDISNPKTLKLALKAWKSDNQPKILADRTKANPKPSTSTDPKRKAAALVGGRSPVKGTQIDYRKASDGEILKGMGLSLFSDD